MRYMDEFKRTELLRRTARRADLTTIAFLVAGVVALFALDPLKRPKPDEMAADAFALGYYLAACSAVEGTTMANSLADASARLARVLKVPQRTLPGLADKHPKDGCNTNETIFEVDKQLNEYEKGFRTLGSDTFTYEALDGMNAREDMERLQASMVETARKLGPPDRILAVLDFCAGKLSVLQFYARLFRGADQSQIPVLLDIHAKHNVP
jgi:hypothetical protein